MAYMILSMSEGGVYLPNGIFMHFHRGSEDKHLGYSGSGCIDEDFVAAETVCFFAVEMRLLCLHPKMGDADNKTEWGIRHGQGP